VLELLITGPVRRDIASKLAWRLQFDEVMMALIVNVSFYLGSRNRTCGLGFVRASPHPPPAHLGLQLRMLQK
jgi:hypothetical protein